MPRRPLRASKKPTKQGVFEIGEPQEDDLEDDVAELLGDGSVARIVAKEKQRSHTPAHRRLIEEMLASGLPRDDIIETMGNGELPPVIKAGGPLPEGTVRRVLNETTKRWREQDEERRHDYRHATMARLHADILQAKKDRAWSAVAQFEKLLAEIQGTREPRRVQVDVRADLRMAVEAAIGSMSPGRMRQLADAHRTALRHVPLAALMEAPEAEPVNPG